MKRDRTLESLELTTRARIKILKRLKISGLRVEFNGLEIDLRESIHLVIPLIIYSKTIIPHYIIFSGHEPHVWTSVIQISRGKTKCAPSNRTTSVSSDEIGRISENLRLDKFDESISRMNV